MEGNKHGRPNSYLSLVKHRLVEVEAWARDGLINEQIAKNLGISLGSLYKYQNDYIDFFNALKRGKEVVDIEVENALLKRALGYSYEEITEELMIDESQKRRHKGEDVEFNEKDWDFAKAYFNFKCCYCDEETELSKDHIIPFTKGGLYIRNNIVPCCKSCNSSKKAIDMKEWFELKPFYNEYRIQKINDYVNLINNIESQHKDLGLKATKRVIKHQAGDTTAQIFWLKNRKPKEWRDKQEIEQSIDSKIEVIWDED